MILRAATGLILCLLLSPCGHNHPFANDPYRKELIKQKLNGSTYCISLPGNYTLKLNRQIDFDVYSFFPRNTADKSGFRGGVYFGNAPGMFKPDSAKCKIDTLHGAILGDVKSWTLYTYKEHYYVQIITPSKSDGHSNEKIHAFGRAATKTELHKLMVVFSTLEKQ